MKEKSDRINRFLLQEHYPDIIKVAGTDKRSSNSYGTKSSPGTGLSSASPATSSFPKHSVSRRIVTAVDHVTQLRLESCRCPQLEEYLPRILDLTICRTNSNQKHPRGWCFANPVHALHMVASQSGTESSSKIIKQRLPPTFMYGEEHHRTIALQTEGIAEYWCSFDGNMPDTAHSIKPQIDVTSSKFSIKPIPKLSKNCATSLNPQTSQSSQRSASLLKKPATSLLGSEPRITKTAETGESTAEYVTSSIQEESSKITPNIQDLMGVANRFPTNSVSPFKPEHAQPNFTINTTKDASFPSSISDPKEGEIALQSDPTQHNTKVDIDASAKAVEDQGIITSTDKTMAESRKETVSTRKTSIAKSETSTIKITSKIVAETKSVVPSNDDVFPDKPTSKSKLDDVSASSMDKNMAIEKTKTTLAESNRSVRDSSLPPTSEMMNELKGSETKLIDFSDLPSIPEITAAPSVHPLKEEHSALRSSSKNDETAHKTKLEAKEPTADEHKETSNLSTKTEHSPALSSQNYNTNDKDKDQGKVDTTVEAKKKLGTTDLAAKDETHDEDVTMSEGKQDKAHKESSPIQTIEKVNTKAKEELSCDSTMQHKDSNTDIQNTIKDNPAEFQVITSSNNGDVKMEENEFVTTKKNEKIIADTSSKDANFDTNDTKATESLPAATSTQFQSGMTAGTAAIGVLPASTLENAAVITEENNQTRSQIFNSPLKPDPCMDHFRREEEKIRRARRSLMAKRVRKKPDTSAKEINKKKRRVSEKSHVVPGWKVNPIIELSAEEDELRTSAANRANETVERWMHHFRLCYESFFVEKEKQKAMGKQKHGLCLEFNRAIKKPSCRQYAIQEAERSARRLNKNLRRANRSFFGDELMQCLVSGFIGCSPSSLNPNTDHGMEQHLLISGNKFAVSCGERALLYCFDYGDFVYHEVFEHEKIRIACARKIPHMAWKEHTVLRSFDPFQFLKTQDNGILWRGLVATYPPMVPKEHFCAAQLTLRRKALFEGNCDENWMLPKPNALYFASSQHLKTDEDRYKIKAPLGIYNLGNTCYMSSILQCLVFCKPLQQFFLRDSGHHFKASEVFRHKDDALTAAAAAAAVASPTKKIIAKSKKPGSLSVVKKKIPKMESEMCLACEMDRLFLSYYGGTVGSDVFVAIEESCQNLSLGHSNTSPFFTLDEVVVPIEKGDPLIVSDLLTAAWKSGGMNHLTGYNQHDAHEFLNCFLDVLGKHIVKFRKRIYSAVTNVDKENAFVTEINSENFDVIKNIFEGSLRSVLLCESCGEKRIQEEPFMNISLSLSEEVERKQYTKDMPKCDLNVESCLEHFVLPEILGDLVYCNACGKKTRTKKQHTFAKLPKILCLHLKRFDAAKNKKIENFVSFPSRGLNMGHLLSHWCEVSRLGDYEANKEGSIPTAKPKILYDLFGTVNHIGTMQSGHYVANVKVDDEWYHCNDQHISHATEDSVLNGDGAYVLFYRRR